MKSLRKGLSLLLSAALVLPSFPWNAAAAATPMGQAPAGTGPVPLGPLGGAGQGTLDPVEFASALQTQISQFSAAFPSEMGLDRPSPAQAPAQAAALAPLLPQTGVLSPEAAPAAQAAALALGLAFEHPDTFLPQLVSALGKISHPEDPTLGQGTGEALQRLVENARSNPAAAKALRSAASNLSGQGADAARVLAAAFDGDNQIPFLRDALAPVDAAGVVAPGKGLALERPKDDSRPAPRFAPVPEAPAAQPAPAENISVKFVSNGLRSWLNPITAFWRLFSFGQVFSVRGLTRQVLNELYIPGDKNNFKVTISPKPEPNANIERYSASMTVFLGLLPTVHNRDEYASVIAHEMAHANPEQFKPAPDDWEVQRILDGIYSQNADEENGDRAETYRQREEIRADLGAVDRMIRAGYNPWAYYNWEERMARLQSSLFQGWITGFIFRLLMPVSHGFWEDHPASAIRMQAVKTYIQLRSQRENLAFVQGKLTPLPLSVRLLRWRMLPLAFVLFSPWIWRGIIAYVLYDVGLALLGLFSDKASATVSGFVTRVLGSIWDVLYKYALSYVWEYALEPALSWVGKSLLRPAWEQGLVPAGNAVVGFFEWLADFASSPLDHLPPGLRIPVVLAVIGLPVLYLGYRWVLYGDDWRAGQLHRLRQGARQAELESAAFLAGKKEPTLDELVDLLEKSQDRMGSSHFLYQDRLARLTSWINGLAVGHRRWRRIHRNTLTLIARQLERAGPGQASDVFNPFERALGKSRGEDYEDASLRPLLERIAALSGAPPGTPGQARSSREPVLNHRLRLRREAAALPPDAAPRTVLDYATALNEAGLIGAARTLFDRHYGRTLDFVLSTGQDHPDAAAAWVKAEDIFRSDRGRGARKRAFLLARLRRQGRPLAERMALLALSDSLGTRDLLGAVERGRIARGLARLGSAAALRDFVENSLKPRNVDPDHFTRMFFDLLAARPGWLGSRADLEALTEGRYFWPKFGTTSPGALEQLVVDALRETSHRYHDSWKFEPGAAEKLHALYLGALERIEGLPSDTGGKVALWMTLTDRGVTSRTDAMFLELYQEALRPGTAIPDVLRKRLEQEALRGRIWEQSLKARIMLQEARASHEYGLLLKEKNAWVRGQLLDRVIALISSAYPEKGVHYESILETISREIQSSKEESAAIEKAKRPKTGEGTEDLGLRVLSGLTETALSWPRSEQWNLVLFLRGDKPPSRRVRQAFRVIGTERVSRMFEILPLVGRMKLLDTFLMDPRGLLGKVSLKRGYGRRILEQVLPKKNLAARRTAIEIMEAFLYAVEDATKSRGQQSDILAYMLAVPRDDTASVGKTIKGILEGFGATGIKLGQMLAASGLLPEEDTRELRKLQERAQEPLRARMHSDLAEAGAGAELPYAVEDLLGAASIKYAAAARARASGAKEVLKLFRKSAQEHTEFEFILLDKMSQRLTRRNAAKFGVFRSLVKASRRAVERELDPENEIARAKIARERIYAGKRGKGWVVRVPRERLLHPRLIASEFAEGVSLWDLPRDLQAFAASAILELEDGIYFADQDSVSFDPDRHPGNYRIRVVDAGPAVRMIIYPIDHGQGLEISRIERDQVFELFALAQILKETGPTAWSQDRLKAALGLDAARARRAARALRRYFPSPDMRPEGAYYSLLAALDDAGLEVPIAFFDFARGILQFRQYEELAGADREGADPLRSLEKAVRPRALAMRDSLKLTAWEGARLGLWRAVWKARKALNLADLRHRLWLFLTRRWVKAALVIAVLLAGAAAAYRAPFFSGAREAIEDRIPWLAPPGPPVEHFEERFKTVLERLPGEEKKGEAAVAALSSDLKGLKARERPQAARALIRLAGQDRLRGYVLVRGFDQASKELEDSGFNWPKEVAASLDSLPEDAPESLFWALRNRVWGRSPAARRGEAAELMVTLLRDGHGDPGAAKSALQDVLMSREGSLSATAVRLLDDWPRTESARLLAIARRQQETLSIFLSPSASPAQKEKAARALAHLLNEGRGSRWDAEQALRAARPAAATPEQARAIDALLDKIRR